MSVNRKILTPSRIRQLQLIADSRFDGVTIISIANQSMSSVKQTESSFAAFLELGLITEAFKGEYALTEKGRRTLNSLL